MRGSCRSHSHRLIAALPLVFTLPAGAAAQREPSSLTVPPARFEDPQRVAKLQTAIPEIDSVFRAAATAAHAPGYAYGLIVDGRLVHVGVGGLRDVASQARVDTGTIFRIASMSKSFAAAAILQLRDEGRLRLDDPVERYVPELATLQYATSDAPKITIRHLLTHSAGFPEDNPWGDQQLAATDAQLSAMMARGIPFSTAPGTAYEYSNFGFAILGRVVASVSGMPYGRYLDEHILRPLGMSSTTLQVDQVPPGRLAHGYRWEDGRWREEAQLPDGAFGPMGGILTSVSDLSRWVGLMLDAWPARSEPEGPALRRASRREMQQVQRYSGGGAARVGPDSVAFSAGGYGYGLGVRQTCDYPLSIAHSGGLPGFGSLMRWLPEHGVGVVALGNVTYMGWGAATDRALALLSATGGLVPRVPQPAPILLQRQREVTQLITHWDDALADSLAAVNLFLDEARPRRRAAIEQLVAAAGGDCRTEGRLIAENALRGRWRLRCSRGDLVAAVTLAPTVPARVQFLRVTPIARDQAIASPRSCR